MRKVSLLFVWPLMAALVSAGCAQEEAAAPIYDTAVVERGKIGVTVGSAGVVEPLATVEVKSKASGEVLELLIETGDHVTEGDLMVRIDPRTVSNRFAQAEAELKAAESRRTISQSQMERAELLVRQGTFTEADHEQAALELANAEAQVVSAEVAVENARIAVDDTDIRAPVSGAIIEKPVEKGQVISSPTQDFGGGTLLLKMADLSAVQVRALIDETDIGKVRAGMPAQVTVAAYPNQPFAGEVVKVEPQAVVEQNVTMFAVIVSLRNPDGLLLPGMNAEVDVAIANREDVLTLPVMALRTERDVSTTASVLEVSEDALRSQIEGGWRQGGGAAACGCTADHFFARPHDRTPARCRRRRSACAHAKTPRRCNFERLRAAAHAAGLCGLRRWWSAPGAAHRLPVWWRLLGGAAGCRRRATGGGSPHRHHRSRSCRDRFRAGRGRQGADPAQRASGRNAGKAAAVHQSPCRHRARHGLAMTMQRIRPMGY